MFSAIIKHDGRRVAFDAARLEASVARAATDAAVASPADAASRLGREIVAAVGLMAKEHGQDVVQSADLRAHVLQALRGMSFESVADAYQNHARESHVHLQRVRIIEPATPRAGDSGSEWDRRRLAESMRAAGVAADLAGATAREVERRVIALGQAFISPALIHALTMLALPLDAFGARAYAVRRVAYSAALHFPTENKEAEELDPLPTWGPALEEFWLQGLHSADAVDAVRSNLVSLDPCPSTGMGTSLGTDDLPVDPLLFSSPQYAEELANFFVGLVRPWNVYADTAERIQALAAALANRQPDHIPSVPGPLRGMRLHFKPVSEAFFGAHERASPVTINAGGLVAREAVRDLKRAAARLTELAGLAAQVHRERETYFLKSPVRGRFLPIAVAGLWNATAWIQGDGFDAARAPIGTRQVIVPLCQALRAAVDSMRSESGMRLALTASVPVNAEKRLWRNDSAFFLKDGLKLHTTYESGPELKLSASMIDFTNRLDFAKAVGDAFDEAPVLTLEVAVSSEIDAAQWSDLLTGLAKSGIARVVLDFTGNARAVPNLTRAIRSYRIGFPLLDRLAP